MLQTAIVEDRRDHPSREWIEALRRDYPTEAEFDRMLTRKMLRRMEPSQPGRYSMPELDRALRRFFDAKLQGPYQISDLRWLMGGASKIQLAFTLDWSEAGVAQRQRLVMRMEPEESLNSTSRLREQQIFSFFRGILPVPKVFWLDEDGTWLPQAAIIYEWLPGVSTPSRKERRVAGIGQSFPPELRQKLGPQFLEALVRIHTADYRQGDLSAFQVPAANSTESALLHLNRVLRIWEEDRGFEFPVFDLAVSWLRRNLPVLDRPSILHGDFRAGNFLFDEATGQITAWLDFERGYIGDRHRDLAWTTLSSYGNLAEDGKTFLVSGLVPLDEFLSSYERLSGLSIDPARLKYYRVFNSLQNVLAALASAWRVVRLGKTHQDVLVAMLEGIGHAQADEICCLLEEDF
ncbi:phosphotransferase family protein [Paracoccus sp. N5]|uniref:phosphotransferase family protein n=1 Tax=Paracoccus sp. N5 TaxID=1101189 RepID=UPI0003649AE9|nr:phosphotransferase family protein [Paracoccus sp. N5]